VRTAQEIRSAQIQVKRDYWNTKLAEVEQLIAVASVDPHVTQITYRVSERSLLTGSARDFLAMLREKGYRTDHGHCLDQRTRTYPLYISWDVVV
jgi:hypothetical protein